MEVGVLAADKCKKQNGMWWRSPSGRAGRLQHVMAARAAGRRGVK